MRVSFSLPLKKTSGKQIFACRLAEALKKKGVKISDKKPHINLVFVKGFRDGCKNILRLDGIWMNSKIDWKNKNEKIKNHLLECDGVVYQNEFCKESSDKVVCKTHRPYELIGNGMDPHSFDNRKEFKCNRPYILALCKWRPHKRLKEIVEGFLASGLDKDYDLRVIGKPDYFKNHKSVIYEGEKPNSVVIDMLVSCEFTVHLAYVDWCPNSVIESIIAKKNVLHTDSGGTRLIVKSNGVCIPETKPWQFDIIKLYNPPPLDPDSLAAAYNDMLELDEVGQRDDLNIDNIADKYLQFFRKILN